MNREETLALHAQGKDAWNAWAERMLAKRKAMEAAGKWAEQKDEYDQPPNAETDAWLIAAAVDFADHEFKAADHDPTAADFSGWVFPGNTDFHRATFSGDAVFSGATFSGLAEFGEVTFTGLALFDAATFSGDVGFRLADFSGNAVFGGARFLGVAEFDRAGFSSVAEFEDTAFHGDANFAGADIGQARATVPEAKLNIPQAEFNRATFSGNAKFEGATLANAEFNAVTFKGNTNFGKTAFKGYAQFQKTTFSGKANLHEAKFSGYALFHAATFTHAEFGKVTFSSIVEFSLATFADGGHFGKVTFSRDTAFENATFGGDAFFDNATFIGKAQFNGVTFKRNAEFNAATFKRNAGFGHATFEGLTAYDSATFHQKADFAAVRSDRAFSLAGAMFHIVPDFIQAHFAEAPRLDNVTIDPRPLPLEAVIKDWKPESRWTQFRERLLRRFKGEESAPACYRALKRLAIQGHDHERQMQFFAGEITSARYVTDWPLAWRFWSGNAWATVARYWFGWLYQVTSAFGRSLFRPLLLWLVTIALGTGYFLSQNPDVERRMAAGDLATTVRTSWAAWRASQPCYAGLPGEEGKHLSGLAEPVRRQTDAATEALHLAMRNAFIVLDGGQDAAHRTFGCLYGVERYGDNPVAIVPSNVTFASAIQKSISGILIFLFGLAIRNMLRMK